MSIAAIFGYEPARAVIARDYPRSPIIRATASRLEAVRYSLDPLLIPGSQSESNRTFLALLASYFSGRHELEAYATDLLAALGDDRRLQTADSLQALFLQLSRSSRGLQGARTCGGQNACNRVRDALPRCSNRSRIIFASPSRLDARLSRDARRCYCSSAQRMLSTPRHDDTASDRSAHSRKYYRNSHARLRLPKIARLKVRGSADEAGVDLVLLNLSGGRR